MKLRIYKILFKIISYFTDKSNGNQTLVKYKLIIGTLIIGVSTAACSQKSDNTNMARVEGKKKVNLDEIFSNIENSRLPDRYIMCYFTPPVVKENVSIKTKKIRSRVMDTNDRAIMNLSVYIKGETQSVVYTDINGFFELEAKATDTLVFWIDGYETREILVNDIPDNYVIVMDNDFNDQVTCYQITRIEDISNEN